QRHADIASPAALRHRGTHDGIEGVIAVGQAASDVEAPPIHAANFPHPMPFAAVRLGACESGHASDRHRPPEACYSPPAHANYTPYHWQARLACRCFPAVT